MCLLPYFLEYLFKLKTAIDQPNSTFFFSNENNICGNIWRRLLLCLRGGWVLSKMDPGTQQKYLKLKLITWTWQLNYLSACNSGLQQPISTELGMFFVIQCLRWAVRTSKSVFLSLGLFPFGLNCSHHAHVACRPLAQRLSKTSFKPAWPQMNSKTVDK